MFNVDGNIKYWKDTAESNIVTAGILIDNNRLVEGLFFCHMLEGRYPEYFPKAPPKHISKEYLEKTKELL